jgi:putative two-component system response regulator
VKRYTDDLDSAASIIMTLAVMIEARDGYAEGHCHRMANYATALGRSLQLGSDDLQALHRGGFLHDIGMLAISEAVLRKAGALEPEEYELIKSHTLVGDSLVSNLRSLQAVRPIIRHHHELLDGSGYPDRLRGDDIPLLAQIMSLVDIYDAVTTQRPYRQAKPIDEAVAVLRNQVQRGWRRSDLVEQFVSLIESGKVA